MWKKTFFTQIIFSLPFIAGPRNLENIPDDFIIVFDLKLLRFFLKVIL